MLLAPSHLSMPRYQHNFRGPHKQISCACLPTATQMHDAAAAELPFLALQEAQAPAIVQLTESLETYKVF